MSYGDAFKVVGGGDEGWPKKLAKAKRPPKPVPFYATLTFVSFASGRKAIFKDPEGVRHFMKLSVFEEMLTSKWRRYRIVNDIAVWSGPWITEGRARLTRPVEGV